MLTYKNIISDYIKNSSSVIRSINHYSNDIKDIVGTLISAFKNNQKVFICGNGGSFSQAEHFATELICTYNKKNRKPYPVILLGSNNSSLSAWSNDFNYKTFLSREIDALAKRKDVLIVLTTSGGNKKLNQSYNLVNAAKIAKKKNMKVISLTGKKGGDIMKYSDTCIHIKNQKTSFIQETQLIILHIICEMLEEK